MNSGQHSVTRRWLRGGHDYLLCYAYVMKVMNVLLVLSKLFSDRLESSDIHMLINLIISRFQFYLIYVMIHFQLDIPKVLMVNNVLIFEYFFLSVEYFELTGLIMGL